MRIFQARLVAAPLVLTLATAGLPARAADKAACLDAYEQTQKLRKAGKLREAHAKADVCASTECPGAVQGDCEQWSKELVEAQPTIALTVKDKDGADVTDAKVTLDGEPLEGALGGKEVDVDPGDHTLAVERAGAKAETTFSLASGDKKHALTLTLTTEGATGATATTSTDASATSDAKPADPGAVPTTVWILGGVGTLGFLGFIGFGLSASSAKSSLDDSRCKPACAQADVDTVKSRAHLADLSLGVSLLSFGIATVLYLSRGPSAVEPTPVVGGVHVDVAATAHGGAASLTFAF